MPKERVFMNTNYIFVKTQKFICGITMAFIIILLGGCDSLTSLLVPPPPTTIADIAYDTRRRSDVDYRIFIKESSCFVPYLVATANHNGNVLLVREFLLDELIHFNPSPHESPPGHNLWASQDFGGYYEDSYIDNFLNTEFMSNLGEGVIEAMILSNIEITDKSSMGVAGRVSKHIYRHVFLLSSRELGVADSRITVPEGERLDIFAGKFTRRVARHSNGKAHPYWTRTPQNWETYRVMIIGVDMAGPGTANNLLGVRPAFSLYRNTPITTRTDIVKGEYVFVIGGGD